MTKQCRRCGETKPTSEWPKNRRQKDGLGDCCILCKRAYDAAYYRENAEKIKARAKAWGDANPERVRKNGRLTSRRARSQDKRLDADAAFYMEALRYDPCSYCGASEVPSDVDHIVPIAAGGLNDWQNLGAACHSCNASKSNRDVLQFLLARLAVSPCGYSSPQYGYKCGCRCDSCVSAVRAYKREWAAGRRRRDREVSES